MPNPGRAQQGLTRSQQVQLAEAALRYDFRTKIANMVKWVLIVPLSWVPLNAMRAIVAELAGKETVVDANVVLTMSLSYSVASSIGWGVASYRARSRKADLQAVRARSDGIESTLLGLGGGES